MKNIASRIPENAFLKVVVGSQPRRLYFKDVKLYKKIIRAHRPPVPIFEIEVIRWDQSAIT